MQLGQIEQLTKEEANMDMPKHMLDEHMKLEDAKQQAINNLAYEVYKRDNPIPQQWQYTQHLNNSDTKLSSYDECLLQLFYGVTWDGDLLNKYDTREARKRNHANRVNGFNYLTRKGINYLIKKGLVRG